MIEFSKRHFSSLFDRGTSLTLDSMRFTDCSFENCGLSRTTDPNKRARVSNVELKNCSANGCHIGPAVFHDVKIESLSTNDLLIVWGALFERVTMSGDIGKIKINHFVHHVDRKDSTQGPFDALRREFYRSTDWALDISEARFVEFECRGIPAKLIRRHPESQVVVTREGAMRSGWRERVTSSNTHWPFVIDLFLSDGDADRVLVAPLGASKSKRETLLAGLRELRDLGVAEPA